MAFRYCSDDLTMSDAVIPAREWPESSDREVMLDSGLRRNDNMCRGEMVPVFVKI
ncbi:MAG: hypothetical protein ACREVE_16890 [Gammaproteobacteria bacterium]